MNCTEIREKLVEYVEGILPDEQKRQIILHLDGCAWCRLVLEQQVKLRDRLISDGQTKQSDDFENEVLNRIIREQSKRLKQADRISSRLEIVRKIVKSKITKFAAAAVIIIGISVISWISSSRNTPESMSSFNLLSKACASEQKLFFGNEGIVHIVNEIILYPETGDNTGKLLTDMESETALEKLQDRNVAFIKNWLSFRQLPVYSLKTDGYPHENKLELAEHADKAVTISDIAWFDSDTGRFARVLKTGDQVLFANAYDGQYIYLANKGPGGLLQIRKEAVTNNFQIPINPADFLGIAAGIKGSIPQEYYPPIQSVTTESLQDGTPVSVYKLGFANPWGKIDTYFLFKINTNTDVIAEIECVVNGQTTQVHRRMVTETANNSELSWNLSELAAGPAKQADSNVNASDGASIVTIQQMAQRASTPVYIFAKNPSWADDCKIYDLPDEASPSTRFFSATYHAKDGRDIVLTQGESFTRYFSVTFAKLQEVGELPPWAYESKNGFKVIHQKDTNTEMWWTEFALKISGFEPRTNRVGYILMSPAKTWLTLAINGPVSEQELQGLVDGLVPADEYIPSQDNPSDQ